MNNIFVDPEELRECSLGYAGSVHILNDLVKKLKVSSEDLSFKNREKTDLLIKKLEKKKEELEALSLCIKKAADEYEQNEEETAALIRRKLFLNTGSVSGSPLIIERGANPSESAVLFSHLLRHSPMMEEMIIEDAQGEQTIK